MRLLWFLSMLYRLACIMCAHERRAAGSALASVLTAARQSRAPAVLLLIRFYRMKTLLLWNYSVFIFETTLRIKIARCDFFPNQAALEWFLQARRDIGSGSLGEPVPLHCEDREAPVAALDFGGIRSPNRCEMDVPLWTCSSFFWRFLLSP